MLEMSEKLRISGMKKNPVQFQKGLGLLEFLDKYSDEEKCRKTLFRLRWPQGFVCPQCGSQSYCQLKAAGCSSAIAATIRHR